MGKSENWEVPPGHGIVFRKKNVRSCSAVSFDLVVKSYVRMRTQNHAAGAIEYSIGRVCSTVIKYLINCFFGVLCCGGLLEYYGTKSDK